MENASCVYLVDVASCLLSRVVIVFKERLSADTTSVAEASLLLLHLITSYFFSVPFLLFISRFSLSLLSFCFTFSHNKLFQDKERKKIANTISLMALCCVCMCSSTSAASGELVSVRCVLFLCFHFSLHSSGASWAADLLSLECFTRV